MSDERKQSRDMSPRVKKTLAAADLSPELQRALEHLPRLEIFTFLLERTDGRGTSVQRLANAFSMSVRLVEYHLKVLCGVDLVMNVADEKGSGTTEPSYVASACL